MCWSGQASIILASIGFTGSLLEFKKMRQHKQKLNDTYGMRGLAILYFTLMELLQSINYMTLYSPGKINSILSLLGYLHIAGQPFFILLCTLSLIPHKRREYWFKPSIIIAVLASIGMLSRLIISDSLPGCFAQRCIPLHGMDNLMDITVHWNRTVGCSTKGFFSYRGDWHIAWQWALNGCSKLYYTYYIAVFLYPCLFGVWIAVLSYTIFGPILSILTSTNPDEFAAVWCLFSIACISSIKIPAWEKICTVKHESWKDTWLEWSNLLQKINSRIRIAIKQGA